MKRVGILTCSDVPNYGSQLTSYSFQKMFTVRGISCEGIRYEKKKDLHFLSSVPLKLSNEQLRVIRAKAKTISHDVRTPQHVLEGLKVRRKTIGEFAKNNFIEAPAAVGYANLKKASTKYDAVVVGSDQVWAPMNLEEDYRNLRFVADGIPKIAYSSSFGVSSIPVNQRKRTARFLNRIDYISVRESDGAAIVKDLIGVDVPVVLDPTLLFDFGDYEEIIPHDCGIDDPFIFVYLLGNNAEHRRAVRDFADARGLKVVSLPHLDEYVESDEGYADTPLYDVDPGRFLALIRGAEYVCTDSFHGSVFSLLGHKKFVTFKRYSDSDRFSANSRVLTLLGTFGLLDRIWNGTDVALTIDAPVDWDAVDSELAKQRTFSNGFFDDALVASGICSGVTQ